MRQSVHNRISEPGGQYFRSAIIGVILTASAAPSPMRSSAITPVVPLRPVLANVGFASPENLVYDASHKVYLVSNMNGDPRARDANGFVSRVSADGKLLTLKWIDGSRLGTRLDAPKGLAIRGDTLAVADVGCVRLFSLQTGASLGVWKAPGVLLNDVAFSPDGALYVTDTGADSGKTDPNDRDAVFRFTVADHPTRVIAGTALSGPDGIVASDTGFTYSTFKSDLVEHVARSGARTTIATLPGAKVDGLRRLSDGSLVVTSWNAHSVFRIAPEGKMTVVASGINSPAGVTYDAAQHRLAITSMNGNSMYFVTLP